MKRAVYILVGLSMFTGWMAINAALAIWVKELRPNCPLPPFSILVVVFFAFIVPFAISSFALLAIWGYDIITLPQRIAPKDTGW